MSGAVWAIGAFVAACQVALAGRYGWHRDELYFLACGHHLAWGYVDQPPLTPAVARVMTSLFGTSLLAVRFLPAVADGAIVILAGVIARELGGRRPAQVLAAVSVAVSSVILGTSHLLSTAAFDILVWSGITAIFVRLLRGGDSRWWLSAGVVAGVGLENKYTVAFLLGAFAVGVVATRRDLLRSPWLWAGTGIALCLWAPNLAWQAHHGWPWAQMSTSLRTKGAADGNRLLFLPMQLVFLSPVVTPLWFAGLLWTLRHRAGRSYRPLAIAWLVLVVVFLATAGKPYYLVGLYPFLLAAGATWLAQRWRPVALHRYFAAIAVAGVLAAPLGLPILPIGTAGTGVVAAVNPEFRESFAWPQFARSVAQVPGAVVFTQNYGEAGALQRFAPGRPVYSGHNNYWMWGPPPGGAEPVVVVGNFSRSFLDGNFRGCRRFATIDNPGHVPNQERGAGVWQCAGPVRSWNTEWPALRHYNA